MDTRSKLIRILALVPIATALVLHNIKVEGWEQTAAPIRQFFVGALILITLFKFLGLM